MIQESIGREKCRQEVIELTALMRDDSDFSDIREILASKHLLPANTLLAGLVSGEDDSQYGILIVDAGQCILFDINSDRSLIRWESVDDISVLERDFDAIAVGVEMKLNGEVL